MISLQQNRETTSGQKTVSLVLGSGGARGMAHIGVIQWLTDNGYDIRSISGASIGSLVGGIYALDKLDDFTGWVTALTKSDILRLLDFSIGQAGLVKGDRIIDTLRDLVGDKLIEDLPISYTAVASDIVNEKEIWFSNGPLFEAIRASISMPMFFTPAKYGDRELLDGGMLNPVPVAPTFRDATDETIAVNLAGEAVILPKAKEQNFDFPEIAGFRSKVNQYIENMTPAILTETNSRIGFFQMIDQTIDTMQGAIARQKLAAYPPDIILKIPRNCCGTLEFDRSAEMIELGYSIAAKTIRV
ncbi:MAG: patatin-like phospholipase family protein [Sneathiella sp.]|uniref:patatin-like phospholipase family protein n=1 Tax=Sneathiella sp. TaxID=1964365 RepID=UPI0030023B58